MTKIFIIAGEASGDIYGGRLIQSLHKLRKTPIEFYGIGGEKMMQQGVSSLFPMSEISIMGFWEVVPHIPNTLRRINQTVEKIKKIRPDIVITIDSPGFNCRVAKKLQGLGIKLVHYVAPTVWAYKPKRAEKFAKLFDHLLVILPFEPPYFDDVGLANTYIGHPIVETKYPKNTNFRETHKINSTDTLICIMPGSRITEINKILPVFIDAAKLLREKTPNLKLAIPTVAPLRDMVRNVLNDSGLDAIIIDNDHDKYSCYMESNAALVKSGTAAMEVTLAGVPMVVAYKVGAISHFIIKHMVKIKFANLVNIILNKEIIPEMLQEKCNPLLLCQEIEKILTDEKARKAQITGGKKVMKQLGLGQKETPSDKAAGVVLGR